MSSPRDHATKWGIPVNIDTGDPYTDAQLGRIERLKAAVTVLLDVMHECEGTDTGNDRFQSRRMAVANTHIEIALLMAIKGACETK
jgi:hypothetical protein